MTAPGVACEDPRLTAYAATRSRNASPREAAATLKGSQRAGARDNAVMPAVSQALIDFANNFRPEPGPGIEIIATPRYRASIQPDFPIAGPNNVSWIRCQAGEAGDVIREARAIFAPHHLPFMWTLDPGAGPPDFADHLAKHGVNPDPHGAESQVMVMSIDATVEAPAIKGLEIRDALADLETFRMSDSVAREAFEADEPADSPESIAMQERRRLNYREAGNRYLLLATVDGEPAGSAGMSVFAPGGAILQGGSVRPKFRGRGIYRALVAARQDIARRAGVDGLTVWGGDMSAPILAGLGFQKVGWRRFYLDPSTA
jgi:GNAT superfamily N-acetyltransferase